MKALRIVLFALFLCALAACDIVRVPEVHERNNALATRGKDVEAGR